MSGKSYIARMESRKPCQKAYKRPIAEVNEESDEIDKVYNFKILLPNGKSVVVTHRHPKSEMPFQEFIFSVKMEYRRIMHQFESSLKPKRGIDWGTEDLYLEDAFGNEIRSKIPFRNFKPHKCHILRLHDGLGSLANTFENMWDLTPDTDLLRELPEEYTYETALADLIDNSLQAVWSNGINERKLVSVEIDDDMISIFDTGPGMDGSDENSIVKWGKIGASLHRSSRRQAIGGKPPYLVPFFGMFGYGGPIASMHLGRHVLVSSKTKESKKVYNLHLEREALISSSGSEQKWRTDGGIRDPSEDEAQKSPHGSFTKVAIYKLKMKRLDIFQLQCKLKDIYFPYIQCDEVSNTGKTITPIEFQVNGIDLAEVAGGEVATTNLHSCNGPDFVLGLHFYFNQDSSATKSKVSVTSNSPGVRAYKEANARLKCVYFPVVEGKENIQRIFENLEAQGSGITENYESFSRVSIRRLGRLLPDARWAWLPLMELKQKKGDKAQILKRCCSRVKCFIETDAGFNPTPSKTDLAHHHPFTTALKNFGAKSSDKENGINVEIYRAGKQLSPLQLDREYQDWIFKMHDCYDEEIDHGDDQPVLVVNPNKKELGVSSDVLRVHQAVRRKGASWKSGQKIKILKGACAQCHKNNIYATLEFILLEGLQGDSGGYARLICRPVGLPDEDGCILVEKDGITSLDRRGSLSLPISVIDSGKCLVMGTDEWNSQLEKLRQKAPSSIDILSARYCQELDIDGVLPVDVPVIAGHVPPNEIVAVIRPASFLSCSSSKKLEQKYIIKDNFEMSMEVKHFARVEDLQSCRHIYSGIVGPSARNCVHGLYIFSLQSCKFQCLFKEAGVYTFSFSLRRSSVKNCEKKVLVKPSSVVGRWELLSDERSPQYVVRVGSCFPPFSIACYDIYNNRIPFTCIPEVMVKLNMKGGILIHVHNKKMDLSRNKLTLSIKDVLIECSELDRVRPDYEATLMICSQDESFSISVSCQVIPGSLCNVKAMPADFMDQIHPGRVIQELVLEIFDAYGNHAWKGSEVQLNVDGLFLKDRIGSKILVDDHGCVDLSGYLKVTAGYGENVSLFVVSDQKVVFEKVFQTEKRELRIASTIPEFCISGSLLENVAFEIVNTMGDVDETINDDDKYGQSHTLKIKTDLLDADDSVRYTFQNGRCIVPSISLPRKEGIFCFVAAHSRHSEISLNVKVVVRNALKSERDYIGSPCSAPKLLLRDTSDFMHAENLVESAMPDANIVGKAPKLEQDYISSPCSAPKLLLGHTTASMHVENLVESTYPDGKGLQHDVCEIGLRIAVCEEELIVLKDKRDAINQDLSGLQASMEFESSNILEYDFEKEETTRRIESKGDSAAAVLCNLDRKITSQQSEIHFKGDIIGIVALLGNVCTSELSRILSEYLGEDQMLAVVCKSYATADTLEKYKQNGNIDREHALYAVAMALGKSINGRFHVICLENLRPYAGDVIESDPQKKLALQYPTSPTGDMPLGFLGYAVNMISIHRFDIMTSKGHGLRETLFYRLFGELHVYDTREHMRQAFAYIKHGAVSLDGGIVRGNGVVSLGYCEPDICFPVVSLERQINLSQESREVRKQIEEKEMELMEVLANIGKETKTREKFMKKFKRKRDMISKSIEEKEKALKRCYLLEYKPKPPV